MRYVIKWCSQKYKQIHLEHTVTSIGAMFECWWCFVITFEITPGKFLIFCLPPPFSPEYLNPSDPTGKLQQNRTVRHMWETCSSVAADAHTTLYNARGRGRGSALVSTFLSVLPLLLSINLTPSNEQAYNKSVKIAKQEAVQNRR